MAKIIKFNPKGGGEKEKETEKVERKSRLSGEGRNETAKGSTLLAKPDKGKNPFEKSKRDSAEPLTQEDLQRLFEPFKGGLKKLYPSQVEDVLGFAALGEKNGEKTFMVGRVIWKRYGVEQPYVSTFVAYFEKEELKKVSFLEAKNNYWDWKTMLKVHKSEFHTEEIFNRFMELVRGQFLV